MTFFETTTVSSNSTLSLRQRWSMYISYILIIIGIFIGINSRNAGLYQTSIYTNVEAGITALYPTGWLLAESNDYIFQVRNMRNRGYKTMIQVTTLPVTESLSERNLLDSLSLNRSQTLIDYNVLGYDNYSLSNETPAISMSYAFVARDTSPFLEGVSSVVVGLDVLIIQRGQAIVITFRADSTIYQQELSTFNRFMEALEF